MMNGLVRRVGRPPKKKIRVNTFGSGICRCCYRRVDHGVCGCDRRTVGTVVLSEQEAAQMQAITYADQEVFMCVNEAGMPLSDDESVVSLVENSANEEEIRNEDRFDEEVDSDSDVEVMRGELHELLLENIETNGLGRLQKCRNCCRKKCVLLEDEEPYALEILLYECTGMNKRLKFCTLKERDIMDETEIALCSECASFLILAEKQTMRNVWAAFMWNMIRNELIDGHVSVQVWSYIPMKWRHWWIDDFRSLHSGNEEISLCIPEPIFEEITDK